MHIILMGKPASGKGTIAKRLIEDGYYQLSGSDLLRENSKDEGAKYYKEARYSLDNGVLVADDIINGMIVEKIKSLPKSTKFVFDGYPRTLNQTELMLDIFDKDSLAVVYLEVEDSVLKERIVNRLTCKNCQAPFNKITKKPKINGICDYCGGELYQRVDDNEETFNTRILQYNEKTLPIIEFLRNKGLNFLEKI